MQYSYVTHSGEGKEITFIKLHWSSYISDDKLSKGPAASAAARLKHPITQQYEERNEIFYSLSADAYVKVN